MHARKHPASLLAFFAASLALRPSVANAQERERTYDHVVVIRQDGERFEGHTASLTGTHFVARSKAGALVEIPLEQVKTLYVADGSKAGVMAASGAAVGLVSGLVIWANASGALRLANDPAATGAVMGVTAGLMGAGALLGALVGAGMTDWRVEPVVIPGQQYAVRLSLSL